MRHLGWLEAGWVHLGTATGVANDNLYIHHAVPMHHALAPRGGHSAARELRIVRFVARGPSDAPLIHATV